MRSVAKEERVPAEIDNIEVLSGAGRASVDIRKDPCEIHKGWRWDEKCIVFARAQLAAVVQSTCVSEDGTSFVVE